jgi:hypothetical protein
MYSMCGCWCVMAVIWGFTCIAWVWVVSGRLLVLGFVCPARTPGPGLQAQALCPPAWARGPMALALRLVRDGFVCFLSAMSACTCSLLAEQLPLCAAWCSRCQARLNMPGRVSVLAASAARIGQACNALRLEKMRQGLQSWGAHRLANLANFFTSMKN